MADVTFRFGLMQSKFDETLKLLNVADRMLLTFAKTHEPTNGAVEKRRKDLSAIFEHHFGVLALHTNKPPDSLRHLKAHRDMLEDNYPEEYLIKDSRWGVAWNELGNAYLQNQRAITAEECFRKSINVLNSLESTTTNTLSMPQINLAFALWLQNRLEEAEEEFVAVLEQRAYAYGEDDTVSFACVYSPVSPSLILMICLQCWQALSWLRQRYARQARCCGEHEATRALRETLYGHFGTTSSPHCRWLGTAS